MQRKKSDLNNIMMQFRATGMMALLIASMTYLAPVPVSAEQHVANSGYKDFPTLDSKHIKRGLKGTYNSNPPTSGDHDAATMRYGAFNQEIPAEYAVHILEHGGFWITYQPDIDADSARKLLKIATKYPNAVIMGPRPGIESKISIASWGRLLNLQSPDIEKIEAFMTKNINRSPEKFASLAKAAEPEVATLVEGKPFPEFLLVDVDANTITTKTQSGKPTILWFTTAWCVPCQIGAKVVAKLDDEMGGNAFDVVVIFVDPKESDKDLRLWKERFANKDWSVAFDNKADPLAAKVALRYLDSKYLIDSKGVLQNSDFRIADNSYLATIRAVVEAN